MAANAETSVSIILNLIDRFSGPSNTFRGQISKIRSTVDELKSSLSGVTGPVTSFLAGFISFDTIRKSLDEAKKAEENAQRLKIALQGNSELFDKIVAQAAEAQKKTVFDDDSIIAAAAALRRRGVAEDDLQRALSVSIDYAAKFNTTVEDGANAISKLYGGRIPRGLDLSIKGLKDMDATQLALGKGLDLVEKNVKGAAEAFAQTDFGKAAIQGNLLSDTYEDLGKIFVKLQVAFLPGVTAGLRQLVDQLESPAGKQFIATVATIIGEFAKWIPTILETIVALKGLEIGVSIFTAMRASVNLLIVTLGLLTTPLGIVIALLAAVAIGMSQTETGAKALNDTLGPIQANIIAVFDAIKKGQLSLSDLWAIIVSEAKSFYLKFKANVVDKLTETISYFIVQTGISFKALFADFKYDATVAAKFVADTFLSVVRSVASAVDKMTGLAADALSKVSKSTADTLRTNIAASIPTSLDTFDKAVDDAKSRLAEVGQQSLDLDRSHKAELQRIDDELKSSLQHEKDTVDTVIAKNKIERDNLELKKKQNEESAKSKTVGPDTTLAQEEARAQRIASLQSQNAKIRARQTTELLAAEKDLETKQLESLLARKLISVQDYTNKRIQIETGAARKEAEGLTVTINALQAKLALQAAAGKDYESTLSNINTLEAQRQLLLIQIETSMADISEESRRLLAEETKFLADQATENEIRRLKSSASVVDQINATRLEKEREFENELIDLRQKGASDEIIKQRMITQEYERQSLARQSLLDLQKGVVDKANEAQSKLQEQVSITTDLIDSGLLTEQAARDRNNQLVEEFIAKLKVIREEVAKNLPGEELAQFRNDTFAIIDSIQRKSVAALDKTQQDLNKFREAVQGPLTSFVSNLGSNFKNVGDAFRQLAQNILQNIANLFAQAAVNKFLNLLLGSTQGGAGNQGLIGGLVGGVLKGVGGFAEGGLIPGHESTPDTRLAAVTGGEYVSRQAAVDYYGPGLFEALNRQLVPRAVFSGFFSGYTVNKPNRFAEGGYVSQNNAPPRVTPAIVVSNRRSLRELLRGNEKELLDVLSEHPEELRSILGG